MRYFLQLSYDGTPYHGWQRQPNASSVQQTLEEALGRILRAATPVTGAGRTDTGVNARVMYAHFDSPAELDVDRLPKALNSLLGPSIAVERLIPVADDAHARFDATSRTYKYFVIPDKNPFLQAFACRVKGPLDVDAMNAAAARLLDVDDFTSFAKLHADSKTNICYVTHAAWTPLSGPDIPAVGQPGIVFTITADRFLRNMVRAVVGTLLDVGRGKLSPDGFSEIIRRKDRCAAGQSVDPQALFLWDITYPYI